MSEIQQFNVVQLLADPTTPTVTPQGTTGATAYSYNVAAVDTQGNRTDVPVAGATATGNAVLDVTNFNRITWTDVPGATSYEIYRTASAGTPSSTGFIGTVLQGVATFDDTGIAAVGSPVIPSANGTGVGPGLNILTLVDKTIQFSGTFVATVQVQGSIDNVEWVDEGTAATAGGVLAVANSWAFLRMKMTVFTSGAVEARLAGHTYQ